MIFLKSAEAKLLLTYFADLGFDVENQVPFGITKDDVLELLDRCDRVLENHELAEELLPTVSGFFFGSTDYDEWYFEDVEAVKHYIEGELITEMEELEPNEEIYFETWY